MLWVREGMRFMVLFLPFDSLEFSFVGGGDWGVSADS